MKYIANHTGIVFFFDNKPVKVEKDTHQYAKIIKAFDLPLEDQEKVIIEILEQNSGSFEKDGFSITSEEVLYQGERLPSVLSEKVRSLVRDGLPISLFGKFWENVKLNPSSSSVRELYDFLAYKELPITEDGCFLAYKGLADNYWSISGNTKTLVVKGKANNAGKIFNGIGEEIEVVRRDVDDNRNNHCSFGLHVGSLDYAQGFSRGKVVVVKVNPKDVVSVPSDYNCQKCRVSAYKVVSDFKSEIKASVADEEGEAVISNEKAERSDFVDRIDRYLTKKYQQGFCEVTVKSIQGSFSPECPSALRIKDAVEQLGYNWNYSDTGAMIVIIR